MTTTCSGCQAVSALPAPVLGQAFAVPAQLRCPACGEFLSYSEAQFTAQREALVDARHDG